MLCDRRDVRTECISPHEMRVRYDFRTCFFKLRGIICICNMCTSTYSPLRIGMYDARAGGTGICENSFKVFPRLMELALEIIEVCKETQ